MAGQRQKAREELAFKRGGRTAVVALVPEGERVVATEPPANLDLCEEAAETWRMVVPSLEHVAKREYPVLVRWIKWVDIWWRATKEVEARGLVEYTDAGSKLSTPFRAMREADMMCQRIEAKFGLDPQAGMRLGLAAVKQETALQRLRGGSERRPPARMKVAG